jgi:two-component system, NtrC family, sensor kinase
MKKYVAIIFILAGIGKACYAQLGNTDSLQRELANAKYDSTRIKVMLEFSNVYKFSKPDSAMYYANRAFKLAKSVNLVQYEVNALENIILTQIAIGNDSKALQASLQALKISEKNHLRNDMALSYGLLGTIYLQSNKYDIAISNYKTSIQIFDSIQDEPLSSLTRAYLAEAFLAAGNPDSALYYCRLAEDITGKQDWVSYYIARTFGKIYNNLRDTKQALRYFRKSLSLSSEPYDRSNGNLAIARIFNSDNFTDSAKYYGQRAFDIGKEGGFYFNLIESSRFLSEVYEKTDLRKALDFERVAIQYKDSLTRLERSMTFENYINVDEEQRNQDMENEKISYRNKIKTNLILGGLGVALLITLILYRNNRQKQKANKVLATTLDNLKATQSQLIQSEKMASLGELTAGIAHEIQNPLNFVNNFSEVNREMLEELKAERLKPNADRTVEDEIINDIISNEDKINHHGKRADAIVKGMLQHSRSSSGQKEPTDINALCDEYLRLAYHGLRAKDKSFNAKFETEFDDSLPKINVVAQDIGRVVLNLINNAFYAVSEKAKQNVPGYEPKVVVSTKSVIPPLGGKRGAEINVKDNGNGIPDSIKEKIFQPFFTTKPTGQGTGLGLSLSYDIVKAHGGEIKAKSREGEGTEFIIQLPA